ncbi:Very-long-chain 3-oxoacyl-CoA 1 [Cyphellophora attinorum]|uniref:Very-long-chain 3-oxoacyl-CoA 1 n=1 Tax=Cyphellophora attinorum TaxID=1664694 RepID=A0A0N0NM32_9EURO|nr:Very-long-chain 3-oxoacyl-CoA 1 [Phialophora attinorum]KPI39991.1 Very-long-chain 3-oxoacyl-CoA 1 [Phialophora attinorum]
MNYLSTEFSLFGRTFTPLHLLAGLGTITFATTTLTVIRALHIYLHRSKISRYHHPLKTVTKNDSRVGASDQPWGLVTGASSGIGLEIANQLAERGFNVILHGRNEAKLGKIVEGLQKKWPVRAFKMLLLDAALNEIPNFAKTVLDCINGLNLTVVIHNIGGSGEPVGIKVETFEEYDATKVDSWINVNLRFSTQLTRVLLPTLIKNQPALLMFISSGSALIAVPFMSIYSGAKIYLNSFAQVLRAEFKLAGHDIEVQSQMPGTVATETSGRSEKDRGFTMPMADEWVRSMFDKVGYGSPVFSPWFGHRVQAGIFGALPSFVTERLIVSISKKVRKEINGANPATRDT